MEPITFDYLQFIADYPQFANISENSITNTYNYNACNQAQIVTTLFTDNSTKYYWTIITLCHILTLQQSGATGRVSQAGQGSENVGFDFNSKAGYMQTLSQTAFGMQIIAIVQQYRAGGLYISDGTMPYLSDSMSGVNQLGYIGG